jgi:Tfp pilus assembly protein PilN
MLRRILRFIGLPGAIAAALSLALAALSFARLERERAHEAEAVSFLRGELARLRSDSELEAHRDKIRDLLVRKQIVEVLGEGRQRGVSLLNEVVDARPAGVALTQLSLEGNRARLRGVAATSEAVQTFASRLAASPRLGAPENVAARAGAGSVEFSLEASLR